MRLRNITLAGIILLVLTFTIGMVSATENATNATGNDTLLTVTGTATSTATATATDTAIEGAANDDQANEGLIGPGNALYGLKIAFENIGETFTFNASEKLGLQVSHARQRIVEARAALKRNDTEAADKALAEYRAKIDSVNDSISKLPDNDTGVINAQQEIAKHQVILQQLLASHPNSAGLQRAYNNSMRLEEKFKLKVERRAERMEDNETAIETRENLKEVKDSIRDNRTEAKTGYNESNESVTIEGNQKQSRRN